MFKEKLDSYKQEFTKQNLVVAEETYIELKSKQEHTLSLKEFMQIFPHFPNLFFPHPAPLAPPPPPP